MTVDPMKVSDLAADLDVPVSTVLAQCLRFGIDATWVGAELKTTEVAILRAELSSDSEPLDLTEPVPVPSSGDPARTVAVPAVPASRATGLPPTAVGSLPNLIDEVTPPPEPEVRTGFRTGGPLATGPAAYEEIRRVAPRPPVEHKLLDRSARNAVVALLLAAVAFGVSNLVDAPAAVAALWLVTALLLVIALVDSIRGRRHVQTRPDRLRGLWAATISLVLVVAAMVGLGASVLTAVGDAPAADAPARIGDLAAVQTARWGYQRVTRIADNDWKRPARDAGTCWVEDDGDERAADRVELLPGSDAVECSRPHVMEVGPVYAVDRDADSPYPGEEALEASALKRCGALAVEAAEVYGTKVFLQAEYPTQAGWEDADHDVACVFLTSERTGSVLD